MLSLPRESVPPFLRAAAASALVLVAWPAHAQSPQPTVAPPNNERLDQDALDPRGLANFDVGSGARAYGMAGAFLARADDATAASWNPAGLSYLRRPEVSLVGRYGRFRADSIDTAGDEEIRRATVTTPDFMAATYPAALGRLSGSVQVSFQRVFTFGGKRTFETSQSVRTVESEGGFDVLAFGGGFRISRALRAGATLNRWINGYEQFLVREPVLGNTRGRTEQSSEYSISGWNANVGVIVTPTDSLNLGIVAKTPFTASVTLERARTDFSPIPGSTGFTQNDWSADDLQIDMPAAVGVGASLRPHSQLTVSADFTRTFWSRARIRNFFTLAPTPEAEGPRPPPATTGDLYPSLPYPTLDPDLDQEDTDQIRVGLEYVILTDTVRYPIRAGYLSDRQPGTRRGGGTPRFDGLTIGAGAAVGPLLFDAAFLYQWANYVEASGERISFHNRRVLVSLIYRHGN